MNKPLLVIFIFLLLSAQCHGNTLKIVTEHWPPYIIGGKEVTGIVTNNIKEILELTEIEYSIASYPWARSFNIALTRPNTLIYSITRTRDRELLFHWFCGIYKPTPVYAFKLKSNKLNINSLESLKQGVIGIMRLDHSYNYLRNKGFKDGVNIDLSPNEETNLKKLIKGRVDVVFQSKESILYRLNKLGQDKLEIEAGLVIAEGDEEQHCMALSLGTNPTVIKKIRKGLQEWQKQQ